MLKKILLTSCLMFTSMASQAALISHYGYERDSSSNIVKGGGLDWLMWDVTKGQSISQALSNFSGWRLASNTEMATLFNTFEFGKSDWTSKERGHQEGRLSWTPEEKSSTNHFLSLFGVTRIAAECTSPDAVICVEPGEGLQVATALYGSDVNMDGYYMVAEIVDDYQMRWTGVTDIVNYGGYALIQGDYIRGDEWFEGVGVALVRTSTTAPDQVPLPSSIGLLAFGLAALGLRRRLPLNSLTS